MKLWISDVPSATHRLIRLNSEAHSGYEYLGEFSDEEIGALLLGADPKIDVEKNLNLLRYFGYVHIFVILK